MTESTRANASVCPAGYGAAHPLNASLPDGASNVTAVLEQRAEQSLRIVARRNRLLGAWAAERMGLSYEEADAYAKTVVQAEFEEAGEEDVVRKLLGDLLMGGIDADESDVRAALRTCEAEARRTLLGPA